jgi:4-alpha-glucanotransferase/malto-oligosyltrehalose synthase
MIDDKVLDQLCTLCGIAIEYTDVWGNRHLTSDKTKQALLAEMGIPVGSECELKCAVEEREARSFRRLLPPVQVERLSVAPFRIVITVPAARVNERLRWTLIEESGQQHEGYFYPGELEGVEHRACAGELFYRRVLLLPHTPEIGYHRLEIKGAEHDSLVGTLQLIVVPDACYLPAALSGEGRVWGPTVQLYGMRSQRNWGIGDFTDLKMLIEFAAQVGAGIVGLNPLHALFVHTPNHASPYSPSSRIFLNALYLDVEAIPDFAECELAQETVSTPQFQAHLRALRAGERVDYGAVASVKFQILEPLYRHFRNHYLGTDSLRGKAFRTFKAEAEPALLMHALFETLQEHFYREDPAVWGWPEWPEAYRDPTSEQVAAFAAAHQERIEFFEYLQWQAELQLGAAGRRSLELGLGVGIYQDLAVSIDPGGAETWANQGLYALNARIGAPADEINRKGQNWGLLPPIPERLREAAYAPLIATLRKNMRHAGALRIDHVMGLMRLYWVPSGGTSVEGAYVSYPFEDLLGVLSLESQRNRCMVIGEDLGTVPDTVREALQALGILSYRLFYFERTPDSGFKAPAEYPTQALVAISTHDLPTLSGYWQGSDLDLRCALGLFPSEEIRDQQIIERAQDRARLLMALERESLLPAGATVHPVSVPEMTAELTCAVHIYLARTPAKVMAVQLEDVFGQREQVNLPATTDQYANWRRKLSLNLEDWLGDPRMQALICALRKERGARPLPALVVTESVPVSTRIPRATYRLQFNRDFTFKQAATQVPYLHTLGISHCYASPYLKARPGSAHGYDIIDHNVLNPAIGSPEEFERYVDVLQSHGMGQILDMVPNHMGVMGSDNAWWLDVLENGPGAIHARFFDIDWQPVNDALRGKVLLPVLGDHYGVILENGELALVFDAESGSFSIRYYEHRFPIDPKTYPHILSHRLEQLAARLSPEDPGMLEYQSLITAFSHLPERTEPHPTSGLHPARAERNRDKEIYKQHLAALCSRSPDIAWFIEETVREFNGKAGEPRSFDLLHALLEAQAYRLAHWRVASDDINYRRFFDINDLAALRMEDEPVFEATHGLILQLLGAGKLEGLRIDHPDGLYHPVQYYKRIQARFVSTEAFARPEAHKPDTSKPLFLTAEKILASHERLPEDWPVHGTTGYDFANLVNGLFVDISSAAKMDRIYAAFIGERMNFDELLYRCKKLIMKMALASELNVLANQLSRIAQADWRTRDFTLNNLRDVLTEVVACFPVYRTYITGERISAEDRRYVDWAVAAAKRRSQAADISVFDFVREILLTEAAQGKPESYRTAVVTFAMKFQQYTSPVMAKGLEDTSFYIYNRLVSLNEVGGDPRRFGTSVAAFHHANQERARHWPHAMLCTSTHDSKRSEDVRARINVLSELPEEWQAHVQRWHRMNRRKKRLVEDTRAPSRNDEYLLYQTLIGTWPLKPMDEEAIQLYCERIDHYMLKAVREAKVHSSWINPNVAYEEALTAFIQALLLENPAKSLFLAHFQRLQGRIARLGMFNSLSQSLLKFTSPGVPDLYQGTELWDFSLVDPDNRRAVDYAQRQAGLRSLQDLDAAPRAERVPRLLSLLDSMEDGRIKLYVIWKALAQRLAFPELFREGNYHALSTKGQKADHVCAFARHYRNRESIVVVPRLVARLLGKSAVDPLGSTVWGDTYVELSPGEPRRYLNVFTAEVVSPEAGAERLCLPLAAVLANFPVALLASIHEADER